MITDHQHFLFLHAEDMLSLFSVPYSEECRFDNNNDRMCVDSAVCMDNGSGTRQCLCPEGHRWDMGLSLCVHDNGTVN